MKVRDSRSAVHPHLFDTMIRSVQIVVGTYEKELYGFEVRLRQWLFVMDPTPRIQLLRGMCMASEPSFVFAVEPRAGVAGHPLCDVSAPRLR